MGMALGAYADRASESLAEMDLTGFAGIGGVGPTVHLVSAAAAAAEASAV